MSSQQWCVENPEHCPYSPYGRTATHLSAVSPAFHKPIDNFNKMLDPRVESLDDKRKRVEALEAMQNADGSAVRTREPWRYLGEYSSKIAAWRVGAPD